MKIKTTIEIEVEFKLISACAKDQVATLAGYAARSLDKLINKEFQDPANGLVLWVKRVQGTQVINGVKEVKQKPVTPPNSNLDRIVYSVGGLTERQYQRRRQQLARLRGGA